MRRSISRSIFVFSSSTDFNSFLKLSKYEPGIAEKKNALFLNNIHLKIPNQLVYNRSMAPVQYSLNN